MNVKKIGKSIGKTRRQKLVFSTHVKRKRFPGLWIKRFISHLCQ